MTRKFSVRKSSSLGEGTHRCTLEKVGDCVGKFGKQLYADFRAVDGDQEGRAS